MGRDRVVVGRVSRPHGTAGFVVVRPESDHPKRFRPGSVMATSDGRPLLVREVLATDGPLLVRFEQVDDRTAAESLRGAYLTIGPDERRPLDAEEFWPDELVGLEVRLPDGAAAGTVTEVVEGPAQERLVVETVDGRVVEVPFVAELVPLVEPGQGFLVVVPLEGLL